MLDLIHLIRDFSPRQAPKTRNLPDHQSVGAPFPTLIVGPASSTRKQAPSLYAERFSHLGYAALAFDHTGYGDSEGALRSDEDPFVKSEDIKNAVSFLLTQSEIDPDRLVAVGICAGGRLRPLHGSCR